MNAPHLSPDALDISVSRSDLLWDQGLSEPDPAHFAISVDTLLSVAAAEAPDDTALWWRGSELSFADVDKTVDVCSAQLIARFNGTYERGLNGARIGLHVKKDPVNVALFFAILRAGGIVVPLNPALKVDQFEHIAADCDMLASFMPQTLVDQLGDQGKQLPTEWLPISGPTLADAIPSVGSPKMDIEWCRAPAKADTTAILFYTSGSTGRAKGVMVSHQNNVLGAASVAHYLQLTQRDRVLTLLPLSFDYGFNQIVSAWLAGGAVVLHDFFMASDVPKIVQKAGVTGIAGVPPLWHMVLDATWDEGTSTSIRYVTNSGGKLSVDIQDKMRAAFPDADIFSMYGLTEAFRSTFMPPSKLSNKPGSIGVPIPFAKIAVARPDGTPADADEPGELVHAGPLVAQGYWNNPARTAERFRAVPQALRQTLNAKADDVCVFSGDQVEVDVDGDLHFVGRLDDLIKVLGNRLSPQEIEDVVRGVVGVEDVAAFGLDDARMGAKIVVVVYSTWAPDELSDLEMHLRSACKVHLPSYAQPSAVLFHGALPKNPNGKIDRPTLKRWAQDNLERGTNHG